MGDTACKQDSVNLPVRSRGHGCNVLADVQDISFEEYYGKFITGYGHVLNFQKTVGTEISHGASPSYKLLLYLVLGVLAAEAHVYQFEGRATPGTFGSDGAVSSESVVHIQDPAVSVEGDGGSSTHMGHNHSNVIDSVAMFPEVPPYNSP